MKKMLAMSALCCFATGAFCVLTANAQQTQAVAKHKPAPRGGGIAAQTIVEQLPSSGQGYASQDFEAANDAFDIFVFDGFSTDRCWAFGTAFSIAFNNAGGDSSVTTDVVAQVWDNLPWEGGSLVIESVAGTGVDHTGGPGEQGALVTDFEGQTLAAGDYYFTIFIVRSFGAGGQAFVFESNQASGGDGVPGWQWNPGEGFGMGPFFPLTAGADNEVNFTITGEESNACGGGCDPCDMNCDGVINAFDIEPFLGLIFDGDDPCCGMRGDVGSAGDTNGDGAINAFDIEPFLACLFP